MKEVNYQQIVKNIEEIKNYNQKKIIAVLKNNAYNFDLLKTVKAIENVVDYVMVTEVLDAIAIRNINKKINIYLANPLNSDELKLIHQHSLDLMIDDLDFLKENIEFLKEHKLHLKINTSMNRFGIDTITQALEIIDFCQKSKLNLIGLATHFALENEDNELVNEAIEKFKYFYEELSKKNDFKIIHAENSYTYLQKHSKLNFCNYARIGILLFGYNTSQKKISITPTMYVRGKVLKIRNLKKEETFSYGLGNKLLEDTSIAIVNIGYGNGILRSRKDMFVKINENKYEIIGNISMSHMYVKVDETVKCGDIVVIYDEEFTILKHAQRHENGVPTSMISSYIN